MKIQRSQITMLVLNQSSISVVFLIVQFTGDQKTTLPGESLYLQTCGFNFFLEKKKIDTPYLTWNSPLVVTFSWFRKSRISDSVAVPPLFIRAIDVLLRAVSALSASTSRCMTASRLFWKVWILGKTSSNWKLQKKNTENYIRDSYFDSNMS